MRRRTRQAGQLNEPSNSNCPGCVGRHGHRSYAACAAPKSNRGCVRAPRLSGLAKLLAWQLCLVGLRWHPRRASKLGRVIVERARERVRGECRTHARLSTASPCASEANRAVDPLDAQARGGAAPPDARPHPRSQARSAAAQNSGASPASASAPAQLADRSDLLGRSSLLVSARDVRRIRRELCEVAPANIRPRLPHPAGDRKRVGHALRWFMIFRMLGIPVVSRNWSWVRLRGQLLGKFY